MNDKHHQSSQVDGRELPTDEQLSSLYKASLQGVNTNPDSDDALLALAQQKAKSIKASYRKNSLPFFGSEVSRGWTSAAAFSVVGICIWVTLQAPLDVFQESESTPPAWESSHVIDVLGVTEDMPSELSELAMLGREAQLMAEKNPNLQIEESKSSLAKQSLSPPVFSEQQIETEPPMRAPMAAVPQSRLNDKEIDEIQRRQKAEAVKAKRQAQLRKTVANDEMVQEKRRFVAPLLNQPASKEALLSSRPLRETQAASVMPDSVGTQLNAEEPLDNGSTIESSRLAQFDEYLKILKKLIEDESWSESRDLHQKLVEEYEEFSIPTEILEQLEALRKKVGDTDTEAISPGKAHLPSDLPSSSD